MKKAVSLVLRLGFAVLLAALGGVATPAAARPSATFCSGHITGTTIAGDLVVPAGVYCELSGVTVLGSARVGSRSTFAVYDSRIAGDLSADSFELVTLENANVGGRTRLSRGVSAWFEGATLSRGARIGDVLDTRVLQTQITGDLDIRGSREQVQFCGSTVTGDARFAGNEGWVRVGGELAGCAANEVHGSLYVQHNRQEITVANNLVGRDLVCAANEPAPAVFGNRIGGKARGQCGAGEPVSLSELREAE